MIKKMVIGCILMFMGFFLVVFQINIVNQMKDKDELVKVYILNEDMDFGKALSAENLSEIYIRKSDNRPSYVDVIDLETYYLLNDKKENSILMKSEISSIKPEEKYLNDGLNNIITLELGVEQANAWNFKEFDTVDLYFVSNVAEKQNIIYEDIVVYKIAYSDPRSDEFSSKQTPEYVSLLVPRDKSLEILSSRNDGEFEIVLN